MTIEDYQKHGDRSKKVANTNDTEGMAKNTMNSDEVENAINLIRLS